MDFKKMQWVEIWSVTFAESPEIVSVFFDGKKHIAYCNKDKTIEFSYLNYDDMFDELSMDEYSRNYGRDVYEQDLDIKLGLNEYRYNWLEYWYGFKNDDFELSILTFCILKKQYVLFDLNRQQLIMEDADYSDIYCYLRDNNLKLACGRSSFPPIKDN